jgi:hypothetical protein
VGQTCGLFEVSVPYIYQYRHIAKPHNPPLASCIFMELKKKGNITVVTKIILCDHKIMIFTPTMRPKIK